MTASVVNAFFYLQWTSLRNQIIQRIKRLRQPKYLIGAVVGGGYLYLVLFRQVLHSPVRSDPGALPLDLLPFWVSLGALALLLIVALAWLVPSRRAALKFSEAEVAFLFPAPLTRRMLIHFQLLRSQLGIFFSAFVMSLLFRRGGTFGATSAMHAAGWWLLLSTVNLHFIGASFTRERWLELGINNTRRRWLISMGLLLLISICVFWLRRHLPAATAPDVADGRSIIRYLGAILAAAPVSWLLAPFRVLVAPLSVIDPAAFLLTFVPALGLLAAHYVWVLHSNIAFEEASIAEARRGAERRDARRSGNSRLRSAPSKPRTAPFRLAGVGWVPIAFLWKNLIALGPFFRLRTWLIAGAIIVLGSRWLGTTSDGIGVLEILGGLSISLGLMTLLSGPMFMQRGLQQTLEYMDVLKASPLRGWQIVLGELLVPMLVLTMLEWLFLLLTVVSHLPHSVGIELSAMRLFIAMLAVLVVVPPLSGLMLCVPFAGLLYFPAWTSSVSSRQGGIEVMGQRMIAFAAYFLMLVITMIPAVVVGGIVFFLGRWLGNVELGVTLALLLASAMLAVEMLTMVWWLGERIENFDLSLEGTR